MRDLVRSILWIIPGLLTGALLLFALLHWALGPPLEKLEGSDDAPQDAKGWGPLPLFLNLTPQSAQEASEQILQRLRARDPDVESRIDELGGVLVLHALPKLGSLDIDARRRLVKNLQGTRRRMGLAETDSLRASGQTREPTEDLDAEILFWSQFVNERAIDYRPQVRTRLVNRYIQGAVRARMIDLIALDTYALPVLVQSLGRIDTDVDVARARLLTAQISELLSRNYRISPDATPREARRIVTELRRYWDRHGAMFVDLSPFERFVASIAQTEFSIWAARLAREVTGVDDRSRLERAEREWLQSAPALLGALLGLSFLGPLLAVGVKIAEWRRVDPIRRFRGRLGLNLGLGVTVAAVLASPLSSVPGALLATLCTSLLSANLLHKELVERIDYRTALVLRARSRSRQGIALLEGLTASVPTLLPLGILESFLFVSLIETNGAQPGVGAAAWTAFRSHDIESLLLTCLLLAVFTSLIQIIADTTLGFVRARLGDL